jgi:hypothetical protein
MKWGLTCNDDYSEDGEIMPPSVLFFYFTFPGSIVLTKSESGLDIAGKSSLREKVQ